MQLVHNKQEVRLAVAAARAAGLTIGFVPTMGALHQGHQSLIGLARRETDWVALSVFVNPLQFGPAEDLARYPRDLERDTRLAERAGAQLLFAPSVAEMYPEGEPAVAVVPERGTDRLCGISRPGHFRGVLTVVAKLFGIVSPDVAVFGQKDFQQFWLIQQMVQDLDMRVRVRMSPIVREPDGLAMSSRNRYLKPEERKQALALVRGLEKARALFANGERDADVLRAAIRRSLNDAGLAAEYAEVVDARTLERLTRAQTGAVCLVASRVGDTRLIDNFLLD